MRQKTMMMVVGVCLASLAVWGCPQAVKTEFKYAQADFEIMQGDYQKAVLLLKEYVASKPDSARARSRLGYALMKAGQLDEAERELTTALEMAPGDPRTVLYLGMTFLNQNQVGKAIGVLQGYRNNEEPEVEAEIKRQLTLILIAHSRQLAVKALAAEKTREGGHPAPNTVAVCYYKDLSPDRRMRAYQKGLAAMVITDLSKVKSLRVLERLRLQALLEEMKLGQTGIVDKATAPRLGLLLEAESVVVGSLSQGSILVATAVNGKRSGTASAAVDQQNFFQMPMLIARDVAKILGIVLSAEERSAMGIPHTKNLQAFIYYGQGLDELDRGNWGTAQEYFTKALEIDPRFDLAAEALSSCPGPGSPSISQLALMYGPALADQLEAAYEGTQSGQSESDLENVGDMRGGREGEGGNGGGH